jgi:hypothetical protein
VSSALDVANGGGVAARFWPGTCRRGAALEPVTQRGEGDELDSAWS